MIFCANDPGSWKLSITVECSELCPSVVNTLLSDKNSHVTGKGFNGPEPSTSILM